MSVRQAEFRLFLRRRSKTVRNSGQSCKDKGFVEMSGCKITGEIFADKSFTSMLDEDVVQSIHFFGYECIHCI